MKTYMPEVEVEPKQLEDALKNARQLSAGLIPFPDGSSQRCVAIVTPGRLIVPVACPAPDSCGPEMVAAIREMVPREPPQQVVAIAFTDLAKQGALTSAEMSEIIPFLGLLVGMAYIGHNVVVFEGHPSALAATCRHVDLVLVDEEMVPHLQPDWQRVVQRAMWRPDVRIVHRDTGNISFLPPA